MFATLRRPHQVQPVVFLRARGSVGEKFGRVFVARLAQGHVAETGARRRAKAARLAKLCNHWQGAAAGLQRVLKMFVRSFEIVIRKRDAPHAQLESHINDRDAIFLQLFSRFQ